MSPGVAPANEKRLKGKRLGVSERTLLVNAPGPMSVGKEVVLSGSHTRGEHKALQGAARRLEDLGLLELRRMTKLVMAKDERLQRPQYRHGRFWILKDPRRRQRPRVLVYWATPRGVAVSLAFRAELTYRRQLRWSEEKLDRISRYVDLNPVDPYQREMALQDTAQALDPPDQGAPPRDEIFPRSDNPVDRERWYLAIAAARRELSSTSSLGMWELSCELYRSARSDEEMRKLAGLRPIRHRGLKKMAEI